MANQITNLQSAEAALKELYTPTRIQYMTYYDNPFFALLPKTSNFGGKYKPIPIVIGGTQGRSSNFQKAQTNQTAPDERAFWLKRVKDYGIATIDNETMLASETDQMAFIQQAKLNVDMTLQGLINSAASALFRNGNGSIGKISDVTTGVITLSNVDDVVQFEVNMTLQAAATDGGTPRAALGYVIAVDRSAGTVTVSASFGGAAGTPTSWANDDFLLVDGDSKAKIVGLDGWIPESAPTSGDSFFNVDRSVDPTRLAGVRYDGTSQSIEEALRSCSSVLGREGGRPNYVVMNHASYNALILSLGSKVQFVDLQGPAGVGFKAVEIIGDKGTMRVLPDRNCLPKTAFMLTMDTWKLEALGDVPMILKYKDGNEMLRVTNDDAAELRCGYYAQLSCNAPGWNARAALAV